MSHDPSDPPRPYPSDSPANVTILWGQDALATLRRDLTVTGPVYAWIYLTDQQFFRGLFAEHLQHSPIHVLVDHRQRSNFAELVRDYNLLTASTWATNRTLHDKTFLFPRQGITYISTHNLTRGSWSMSMNRLARIHSEHLCNVLHQEWESLNKQARPILPSELA